MNLNIRNNIEHELQIKLHDLAVEYGMYLNWCWHDNRKMLTVHIASNNCLICNDRAYSHLELTQYAGDICEKINKEIDKMVYEIKELEGRNRGVD